MTITTHDTDQLFQILDEIVNRSSGTWEEKRDAILAVASEQDQATLEEFCAWFETSDGPEAEAEEPEVEPEVDALIEDPK